jgi:hypothetical protein
MVGAGELMDREKINRMGLSLQCLLWYAHKDVLNRIVTGDESLVHHYQPKSKHASMQWKHPSSPSTKKFKLTNMPLAGNIIFTMFWDSLGVLLVHFQKCCENVNPASYREILLKLRDAIRRKHPDQLPRRVQHHNNARTHMTTGNPGENSRTIVETS